MSFNFCCNINSCFFLFLSSFSAFWCRYCSACNSLQVYFLIYKKLILKALMDMLCAFMDMSASTAVTLNCKVLHKRNLIPIIALGLFIRVGKNCILQAICALIIEIKAVTSCSTHKIDNRRQML